MKAALSAFLHHSKQRIDDTLPSQMINIGSEFADDKASEELARLFEACLYSLTNGGKRIRAALVYATAAALNKPDIVGLDSIAGAVEMLHAYSLVHDDLPAMDDDDLRRGKPTCHIAFDEATAILVGDALQSRAFELLSELPGDRHETKLKLVRCLASAAGPRGMVGGQAIDLASVNRNLDLTTLQTMHQLKTGALIRGAIAMAAHWCEATEEQRDALDSYGKAIGLAFQVQDDILDIESSTDVLGKTQGADIAHNKPTYPALLGIDGAKALARQLIDQAFAAIADLGPQAETLRELSHYIIHRQH